MNDNLKTTLDCIKAEEKLKSNTLLFLQQEMKRQDTKHVRKQSMKYIIAITSILIIILTGMSSYNLYFTPSTYVDVDINPSIELTLNRFDRVIGVHTYNADGENIISRISLKHKNYYDALTVLLKAIEQKGYIENVGLLSVTLQTNDTNKETEMLTNIETGVVEYISEHNHHTIQIDVFSISDDTRMQSHKLNISPAKYLAILELMEIDPSATIESCRNHSINHIKQLTRTHATNHHKEKNSNGHHNTPHK